MIFTFVPLLRKTVMLFGFFFASLSLQNCCAPASCPQAIRGFKSCEPVIADLEEQYRREGSYPEKIPPVVTPDQLPVVYEPSKNLREYTLKFTYTGPGVNRCAYTKQDKWQCEGYY
jgi:hypothetical protein